MLSSAQDPWALSRNFFSLTAVKQSLFSFIASKVPAENRWKPEHPKLPLPEPEAQPFHRDCRLPKASCLTEVGAPGWVPWHGLAGPPPFPHRASAPFCNVQILWKCEYRFGFCRWLSFLSLAWLWGLGINYETHTHTPPPPKKKEEYVVLYLCKPVYLCPIKDV